MGHIPFGIEWPNGKEEAVIHFGFASGRFGRWRAGGGSGDSTACLAGCWGFFRRWTQAGAVAQGGISGDPPEHPQQRASWPTDPTQQREDRIPPGSGSNRPGGKRGQHSFEFPQNGPIHNSSKLWGRWEQRGSDPYGMGESERGKPPRRPKDSARQSHYPSRASGPAEPHGLPSPSSTPPTTTPTG